MIAAAATRLTRLPYDHVDDNMQHNTDRKKASSYKVLGVDSETILQIIVEVILSPSEYFSAHLVSRSEKSTMTKLLPDGNATDVLSKFAGQRS